MQRPVGEEHAELSGARVELQSPSPFVGSMVVVAAHRDQIVDVRRSVVLVPLEEVMDLAAVKAPVAVADGTCAVHRTLRSPLSGCGVARAATDVERHAV